MALPKDAVPLNQQQSGLPADAIPLNSQATTQQYAQQASQMPINNQIPFQPNYSLKPVDALTNLGLYGKQKEIENTATLQQKQGEAEQTASQNFGQTSAMMDNLVAATKAAYLQSQGGGFLRGTAANIASKFSMDNTGAIAGLQAASRDASLAFVKQISGSSRAPVGLFNRIYDSMPHDATKNPEQVGSVWGQVFLTTAALEKGIKGGAITPKQLSSMSSDDIKSWVDSNGLSAAEQQQLHSALMEKFKDISPTPQTDMNGNDIPLKPNNLSAWVAKMQNGFKDAPDGKIIMKDPNGVQHYVANKEVEEALTHGWKE